jgi:hypothetical protein
MSKKSRKNNNIEEEHYQGGAREAMSKRKIVSMKSVVK